MAKKDKKKKRLLDGSDIVLAILAALGGSVAFMTAVAIVGSIMFPDPGRVTAEAPSAQPSYRGTLPSRAPTKAPEPGIEESAPTETDAPGPTQTPSEAVPDTPAPAQSQAPAQSDPPAPARTQAPAPSRAPTPTKAPTPMPSRTPAAQNPGPVVSIDPTAPPARQTQAPAGAPGGSGGSGWNTETFSRDNWPQGKFLGSVDSDKYHNSNCRGARRIRPENEIWFNSEDEARATNYSRCGYCW